MVSRLRRTLSQWACGFGFLFAVMAALVLIGGCGGDEEAAPAGGVPAATATNGDQADSTTAEEPATTEAAGDPCERSLENLPGDTPHGGRPGGKYTTTVFQPPFTINFGKHSFSTTLRRM